MLYFAYGSNLLLARMRNRLPSARPVSRARLAGYELQFHKHGMDGSAKCNAFLAHGGPAVVHGALYAISGRDKSRLDRFEGLGRGYREARVEVLADDGSVTTAFSYLATHIDSRLKPFTWYLEHVVAGAREWGLPREYINGIRSVETIRDPDARREIRERAMHRSMDLQ